MLPPKHGTNEEPRPPSKISEIAAPISEYSYLRGLGVAPSAAPSATLFLSAMPNLAFPALLRDFAQVPKERSQSASLPSPKERGIL